MSGQTPFARDLGGSPGAIGTDAKAVMRVATGGGTYKDIVFLANKFDVRVYTDNCIRFRDSDDAIRFHFKTSGQQLVIAKSGQHADLSLDAAANSGAKKWTLRSMKDGSPAGSLKFINETDSGTPTVEFDAIGTITTPGFVAPKNSNGAPSGSDGNVGAIAVDSTNKRIWVKMSSTGSNRWWYASLVQP
jgi:hypothetical protein